jgi:hypothetical protein
LVDRRAPVDEVMALVDLYRRDYEGWNSGTSTASSAARTPASEAKCG